WKRGRADKADRKATDGRLPRWLSPPSVPIQKFLSRRYVNLECAAAEALDRGEDIVGGFGPAQRPRVGVLALDERLDVLDERCHRSVRTALDLLLGEQGEEALHLIDPGR